MLLLQTYCSTTPTAIGVGAGNFLREQMIFCPNFPNLPEKALWDKLFSYKFSVAVGTFYFPLLHVAIDLKIENLLEIWFLTTQMKNIR